MANTRDAKLKVERSVNLKRDFLLRHAAIYEGWLSEQRATIQKPSFVSKAEKRDQKPEKLAQVE